MNKIFKMRILKDDMQWQQVDSGLPKIVSLAANGLGLVSRNVGAWEARLYFEEGQHTRVTFASMNKLDLFRNVFALFLCLLLFCLYGLVLYGLYIESFSPHPFCGYC